MNISISISWFFLFQVGLSCVWLYITCIIMPYVYIYIYSPIYIYIYHIHRSLAAQYYINEIIRPHVKPHIDHHTLADGTAFMQGGATPHTARISQEVLTGAAIDALVWPAKNPDINIIKNVGSVMLRRIKCVNPLPKCRWTSCSMHGEWQNIT